MKKFLLFCLIWIAFSNQAKAQAISQDSVKFNPPRNSVYGELLGSGLFGSLNYERFFRMPITDEATAFRVGVIILPEGTYKDSYHSVTKLFFTMPIELVFLSERPWKLGNGSFRGEWGIGITLYKNYDVYRSPQFNDTTVESFVLPYGRLACKWQPVNKSYFVKAGVSVIVIGGDFILPLIPLPGLAVGYSFGKKEK